MIDEFTNHHSEPERPEAKHSHLIGRERIRGASRMIAEGTDAKSVTDEQIAAIIQDVNTFKAEHKIHSREIAKSVGFSPTTLSEFLSGKYKGDRAGLAIHLDSWLVEEGDRRSVPATTQFVWSNLAMEIKATAHYCLDKKSIGLIYGPEASGFGKTMALQAIYEIMGTRRCSLITIDKVAANPTGLLKCILRGIKADDNGTNATRFARIVEKLRGRSHLLIIDQIHNLRFATEDKPFYILTDLHDRLREASGGNGGAQLWCGTADMVAYFERQQKRNADESLAQIRRRIFPCVDLLSRMNDGHGDGGEPCVSVEQLREMFAKNRLKLTISAARFLCVLANLPDSGSVGLCVRLVEYATELAEQARHGSIDIGDIKAALQCAFSPDRAGLLIGKIEKPMSQATAKAG